jgi:uncharacterized protein YwqG
MPNFMDDNKIKAWIINKLEAIRALLEKKKSINSISNAAYIIQIEEGSISSSPKHKFGGLPDGLQQDTIPQCVNCHHPLHLFFQIDLSDPQLGQLVEGIPYIWILNCLNCDSYWTPLYYRVGRGGVNIELLEQAKGEHFGEFSKILQEKRILLTPMVHPWGEEDKKKHQFGGNPFWVQSEEVPNCKLCGKQMKFVAQVDSDWDVGIQFGDMGLLYAFLCEDCFVFATFMQCY